MFSLLEITLGFFSEFIFSGSKGGYTENDVPKPNLSSNKTFPFSNLLLISIFTDETLKELKGVKFLNWNSDAQKTLSL